MTGGNDDLHVITFVADMLSMLQQIPIPIMNRLMYDVQCLMMMGRICVLVTDTQKLTIVGWGDVPVTIVVPKDWDTSTQESILSKICSFILCSSLIVDKFNGRWACEVGFNETNRAMAYAAEFLIYSETVIPNVDPALAAVMQQYPTGIATAGVQMYERLPIPVLCRIQADA